MIKKKKKQKNKAGRPTKYKKEFCDKKLEEYLKYKRDKEEEVVVTKSTKGYKKTERRRVVGFPSIEGYADFIGIHKDTAYEWAKKYPRFSDALDKIRSEQKQKLIENGLADNYNATITKLLLSANHGMVERKDLTSKGESLSGLFDRAKEDIEDEEGEE